MYMCTPKGSGARLWDRFMDYHISTIDMYEGEVSPLWDIWQPNAAVKSSLTVCSLLLFKNVQILLVS